MRVGFSKNVFLLFCLADSIQAVDYSIVSCGRLVTPMMGEVRAKNIEGTIKRMSGFKTRFYASPESVASQERIVEQWRGFAGRREDVSVALHGHPWPGHLKQLPGDVFMPSVIFTLRGRELPQEVVVVGAHGDSIAVGPKFDGQMFAVHQFKEADSIYHHIRRDYDPSAVPTDEERTSVNFYPLLSEAPGANDNASGVAVLTEMLRILMEHGYRSKRTLQFIVYAGEEVGYIGSRDIAGVHRDARTNVIGVLNFDMTSFRGSDDLDLVIAGHRETTDADQNAFLERLLGAYLPDVRYEVPEKKRDSDHVVWSEMGFRASLLTDSRRSERNGHIHTGADTLDNSGGNADHSVNFAKLGLAYVVEIDNRP